MSKQRINLFVLSLMLGLILSSCGSQAAGTGLAQVNTPTDTGDFVLIWKLWGTPTATPRPPYTPPAQGSVPTVTLSAPVSGSQLSGAAARGQAIFTGAGTCFTCHDTSSGVKIVGPSLKGVASRAGSREPGKSADDYLHESILTPNEYVVQGFTPGIMPQNFSQLLSKSQIDDVVAYLETLK